MTDINEEVTPEQKLKDFIKEKGLEFKYSFVPFSLSRNRDSDSYKTVNWLVNIKGPRYSFNVEYNTGTAHLGLPDTMFMANPADRQLIRKITEKAVETGKIPDLKKTSNGLMAGIEKNLAKPTPQDILYCLVSDSSVMDYLTFESFADDMGLNSDSISDKKMYEQCQTQTENLIRVLGGKESLNMLAELVREVDEAPTPRKNKM